MSEEVLTDQQSEVPMGLAEILKKFPTAPTNEQIEQWKLLHGEVFVSGFSENELYVWRPVKRPEWVKLQVRAQELQVDSFKFEEMVCETCILWTSVVGSLAEGKAGVASALQEQILQNSCFLTPQSASLLVAKL
jgi:tRNA U34 5-methylaminomethyl-2-thiouridine-forming methyltransferase MnmC